MIWGHPYFRKPPCMHMYLYHIRRRAVTVTITRVTTIRIIVIKMMIIISMIITRRRTTIIAIVDDYR